MRNSLFVMTTLFAFASAPAFAGYSMAGAAMPESGQSRLGVVENGVLIGLLCGRDVMDLMEIRAGLAPPQAESTHADNVETPTRQSNDSPFERAGRT